MIKKSRHSDFLLCCVYFWFAKFINFFRVACRVAQSGCGLGCCRRYVP